MLYWTAMKTKLAYLLVFVTVCASSFAEEEAKVGEIDYSTLSYEEEILPLIEVYCMDCHDSLVHKGDLNLERFETKEMVTGSIGLWDRVMKRVRNKEMPPRKEDVQPTDEERDLIVKWIEKLEVDNTNCDKVASENSTTWYPGYVMSRRLNRAEYENTIGDLLNINLEVSDMFPADGSGGEGFDNNGSALFLSAIQVEKYLEAAEIAIETAIPPIERDASADRYSRFGRPMAFASPRGPIREVSDLVPRFPRQKDHARSVAWDAVLFFAREAWRRPVAKDEVDRLMTMYDRAVERGDSPREGLKLAYKAVLVSPNFLFLAEPEPAEMGDYPLGSYQMAARLSYFLWASKPDAELLELAAQDRLQEDEVVIAQVQRMLQDPKARALGEQFAMQWLGITQLGEITKPDENKFPEYSDALAEAMREETVLLFTRIVQENRSLLELIDSDYTYVNEALADIYGIEGIEGEEMRLVALADPNRGGMLGTAAVLTMTSHPLRTSPVLRGKWVLDQLLGDRVPPPPPNVPSLPEEEGKNAEGLSLREQLELHREQAECASCHDRMDPIGFGLENFDPIGRWRVALGDDPVDASGTLPNGKTFNGPEELKQIVLERKDQFAKTLTRKMVGYSFGRNLTRYDHCVINSAFAKLKEAEYRPADMITDIVLSYPFRHRYSNGQTD